MCRFEYHVIGRAPNRSWAHKFHTLAHIQKHRILMRLSDDEFILHLKGEAQTPTQRTRSHCEFV